MTDYPEASDEDATKALEHMSTVAERVRQGKINYKEGLRELVKAGMDPHYATDFLLNVTEPWQRNQKLN